MGAVVAVLTGLMAVAGVGLAAEPAVTIDIVYDNTSARAGFVDDWGFAAVVTVGEQRILFDSGADPELFMRQLERLRIDPVTITHAVISHRHADHLGGIYRLVLRNHDMKVFFLDSFPEDAFNVAAAVNLFPERVTGPREIVPGVYTTGPIDGRIPEQALLVETSEGLVMLVGCGHPGVAKMVEAAERQRKTGSVRLLLGGFHMMRMSEEQIRAEIARLQELHVEKIAPAHCTGEKAKRLIRRAWKGNSVAAGAGRRIVLK